MTIELFSISNVVDLSKFKSKVFLIDSKRNGENVTFLVRTAKSQDSVLWVNMIKEGILKERGSPTSPVAGCGEKVPS
jgi:hypothetical protein